MNLNPLVISGPSGAGKSFIVEKLVADHGFERVVPHTTRPKRAGEVDGHMYNFVDDESYSELARQGSFFMDNPFLGARYGMGYEAVTGPQSRGHRPVTEIYITVLDQFLRAFPDSDRLFLYPSNLNFLEDRMRRRGDPEAKIAERIRSAQMELAVFDQQARENYNQIYYIDSDEQAAEIVESITHPLIQVASSVLPRFSIAV